MAILPKANYIFNAMHIEIQMLVFTEIEKSILKFMRKYKRPPNSKSNPEKNEQCWRYHNIGLQITLQSHSTKTA
jgi:inhibitor of KinA sporulation pathway (predicted exonuclease)